MQLSPRSQDSSVNSDYATEWITMELGFDFQQMKQIFLLHRMKTSSKANPASYTMGTRGCLPRGEPARA
jgi:hypothetical protein